MSARDLTEKIAQDSQKLRDLFDKHTALSRELGSLRKDLSSLQNGYIETYQHLLDLRRKEKSDDDV